MKHALTFLFLSFASSYVLSGAIEILNGDTKILITEQYTYDTCEKIGQVVIQVPEGEVYYFDLSTKQLISECGGRCWHPKNEYKRVCETLCPPPEWHCE